MKSDLRKTHLDERILSQYGFQTLMEDIWKRADAIYEKIRSKVEASFTGKIIAIDVDSGQYFIGDTELEAYNQGNQGVSKKLFVYRRVGLGPTHFIGLF